jgi:hypothetical protein
VTVLRFFFKVTLDRPEIARHLVFVYEPRKLPRVLSPGEVLRLLEAAPSPKHKAARRPCARQPVHRLEQDDCVTNLLGRAGTLLWHRDRRNNIVPWYNSEGPTIPSGAVVWPQSVADPVPQ